MAPNALAKPLMGGPHGHVPPFVTKDIQLRSSAEFGASEDLLAGALVAARIDDGQDFPEPSAPR